MRLSAGKGKVVFREPEAFEEFWVLIAAIMDSVARDYQCQISQGVKLGMHSDRCSCYDREQNAHS